MPLYEPTIAARYAVPLLDVLSGMPLAGLRPLLRAAGLGRAARRRDKVITFAQFDALLAGLADRTGRTDLGFELGRRIKLEHHLTLGVALRLCTTVGECLQLLARFSRLVSPSFVLTFRRGERGGELVWRPATYMSAGTLRALEELFAVSMRVELGEMLQARLLPFDVYLSMQAPDHHGRYAALRPARYHFGIQALPEVKFVFSDELLDLRLPAGRPSREAGLGAQLARQLRAIGLAARWSDWVVLMLQEAEGCQPTRDQLAELLCVSRATFTRHLAAEGHTLRELGTAVRHRRACEMLRDRRQPISQIAYRLGYSDVANFSRAFRAACMLSPSAYRLAHA